MMELRRIGEAPGSGYALIYTRQKVIFKAYNDIGKLREEIKNDELLEIHLFDDNIEYRAVSTRSKRYPEGVIEAVIGEKNEDQSIFEEEVLIDQREERVLLERKGQEKITVLNCISYDENGMAFIDNYRLRK